MNIFSKNHQVVDMLKACSIGILVPQISNLCNSIMWICEFLANATYIGGLLGPTNFASSFWVVRDNAP
jgi:hypothetical protein